MQMRMCGAFVCVEAVPETRLRFGARGGRVVREGYVGVRVFVG